MHPAKQEILDILAELSPPRRVAIATLALEHVLELYRVGHVKAVAGPGIPGVKLGSDLFSAGLDLAWRYANGDAVDRKSVGAVQKGLEKLRKQLAERLYHGDKREPLLGVLVGPVNGIATALLAIDDKKPVTAANALGRAITGVSGIVELFVEPGAKDDEDAVHGPSAEMYREAEWQRKVARRVRDLGDKPVVRSAFADLLDEKLPWHAHLSAFAKLTQAEARQGALTAAAPATQPQKRTTKKPAARSPAKKLSKPKPKKKS
jgi:hypothetical protein